MAATNYLHVVVRVDGKATQIEPFFFDDTNREETSKALDEARGLAASLRRAGRVISIAAWRAPRAFAVDSLAVVTGGR